MHNQVKDMGLPNVMVQNFIPQLELLNDSRVKAFVSHAGGNSILESLYYGKPLIGAPIDGDQHGAAYRVERMGFGISLRKDTSLDNVLGTIKAVSAKDSIYSKKIKQAQKMIHFKDLRFQGVEKR